jgi:glycosyltransferase involved in cell wall biosynthesis
LGTIRAYKGIERLVEVFRRIPDEDLVLVIAGKPWHTMPESQIQAFSQGDRRIVLVPQYIPDTELQTYYKAADAVVLPYTNVLSSGSALLAMSFGRPVIAPAVGCLSELITPETGILYDPFSDDGLYRAIVEAFSQSLEATGENAFQRAAGFTWDQMAKKTLQAYGFEKGSVHSVVSKGV